MYEVNNNLQTSDIFSTFNLLANQGNIYGIYNLGLCYWEGVGVERDYNKALHFYEAAALQGHIMAQEKVEKWKDTWWDGTSAIYNKKRDLLKGGWTDYIYEYNILEGTRVINDSAFSDLGSEIDYSYLEKVTIPSSVVSIGHNPFNKYLSEIVCHSPCFEVDNNTLYTRGKKRLIQCFSKEDEFIIPEEVEYIDDHAFYGCKSKRIIIPSSVMKIGINPFIEMDMEDGVLEVESLSSKFTVTNNSLYEDNTKLISYWGKDESFTLPNGIKTIGEYAFFASHLKTINLTETIESIGDCAFGWCFSLNQVLAPASSAEKFRKIMDGYKDMIRIVKEET